MWYVDLGGDSYDDREADHVVSAIERACETDLRAALRLVAEYSSYWWSRGLQDEAAAARTEILGLGHTAWVFQADFSDSSQVESLIPLINESTPLHGLVNSAAIIESHSLATTSLDDWQKHLQINRMGIRIQTSSRMFH